MTVSTTDQTNHVLDMLNQAQRQLNSAQDHLKGLNGGTAAASRALARAETHTLTAGLDPDRSRATHRRESATQEMGLVGRRCSDAATVGTLIATGLSDALRLVDEARGSILDVEPAGMSTREGADLATLSVRLQTLAEVLTLAVPMAVNAGEHLRDAASAAGDVRHLEPGARALLPEVDTAVASVSIVSRDLGRAEQDGRQLGRVIELAESSSRRVASHADVMHEAARSGVTSPTPSGLLDYPQVLGLNVNDELLLLVHGDDPQANQTRLERARNIIVQEAEFSEKAYGAVVWPDDGAAVWPDEPEILAPTVAHILVRHGGDTKAAVQDPQMVEHLVDKLGYRAGMTPFSDAGDDDELIWSLTTPMDEDLAGRAAVREVFNKLRGEVGVDPINEADFHELAGLDAPSQIGPPRRRPSPTQAASDAAHNRLSAQSRDANPGSTHGEPRGLGR